MFCSLADAGAATRFPISGGRQLIWPIMESAHYFSAQPAGPFTRKPLTVDLAGETRRLQTSSGIFSPDGIDKGTAVLLADVPAPAPQGNLLDIGCGWGPIALTMALRAPHAQVYAVDVNERCVTLTNENAGLLGLHNVPPARRTPWTPNCASTPSGPTRRSGSARMSFMPSCACGFPGWRRADRPGSWSRRTSARTRCSAGSAAELDASFSVTRESTSKSFRILRIRKASR